MKPILFNTEMVRAILDGRKTQTRRIVKPQPKKMAVPLFSNFLVRAGICYGCKAKPAYRPGDILYVRETWAKISDWATVDPSVGIPDGFIYRAEWPDGEDGPKWRPSIHMPKEAARIFLRVTDVRVERLQDITAKDAQAEGCDGLQHCNPLLGCAETIYNFKRIWDSTIKPADRDCYGWAANPWVWVYTFERIEEGE